MPDHIDYAFIAAREGVLKLDGYVPDARLSRSGVTIATGFDLRVEQVAAADVDGDGREDWLVWIGDDSNTGTYQSFQALLIYNVTGAGPLAGEPIPWAQTRP